MGLEVTQQAVLGNEAPSQSTLDAIGKAVAQLDNLATEMAKAKDEDTARYDTLRAEQAKVAGDLSTLKAAHEAEVREAEVKAALETVNEWRNAMASMREPSKAAMIGRGAGAPAPNPFAPGVFLSSVHGASSRDYEHQIAAKATLRALGLEFHDVDALKALYGAAWGGTIGKSTLGTTDATGGWVIPNAVVEDVIKPASATNIYRGLMTVINGVTAATVDRPFRAATASRATVVAYGQTKDNADLAYNGYTETMFTLARIYDIGNQFLRQSAGAAEQDVMGELASAFALGEAYYVREGSGSSEPFGYTSALTNGPSTFRSTFSPSATTLAGSIAAAIATAAGALAGRSVMPDGAVLTAAAYWTMLAQGTDTAGFFFAPANGPTAIKPGTLVSPFGIPVYADPAADQVGTAAVADNLVVAQWKRFKIHFGQEYRVDSSSEAGERWDKNLTGFRGEEEMGFDARPEVYAGYAQMVTDILP